jgi:hypothetical protein
LCWSRPLAKYCAARAFGAHCGGEVVELPCELGGAVGLFDEGDSGCGDGDDRGPGLEEVHQLERALDVPVGELAPAGLADRRVTQSAAVDVRDQVVVDVDPALISRRPLGVTGAAR